MTATLRVTALTKKSRDYGRHSSYYTQAFAFAPEERVRVSLVTPRNGLGPRGLGRIFSACIGAGSRNQSEGAAELEFLARSMAAPHALGHIANVEDHLPFFSALRRKQPRWLATVHFPASHWREGDGMNLRWCAKIITLCRRDAAYFGSLLGPERIALLLHGVDTDFFSPEQAMRSPRPRVIFVGKWLRDFAVAADVLTAALARWPALEADIVVARRWTANTPLSALDGHPRVCWHENVSDEQLQGLYRRAWLLLLPLIDTSANNALVEAMASGAIPIVNNVGGVGDYGGQDVFPTTPDRDSSALLALLESYLNDPQRIARYGQACRDFAVARLDWRLIRAQHRALYEEVAAQSVAA